METIIGLDLIRYNLSDGSIILSTAVTPVFSLNFTELLVPCAIYEISLLAQLCIRVILMKLDTRLTPDQTHVKPKNQKMSQFCWPKTNTSIHFKCVHLKPFIWVYICIYINGLKIHLTWKQQKFSPPFNFFTFCNFKKPGTKKGLIGKRLLQHECFSLLI